MEKRVLGFEDFYIDDPLYVIYAKVDFDGIGMDPVRSVDSVF